MYKALYNETVLDGIDILEATNITVEDLTVEDNITLPNLSIPNSALISIDGNKINDPLYIDNIYEKSNSHGIRTIDELRIYGGLVLMSGDNVRKFNIQTPMTSSTDRYCIIPDMGAYASDYFLLNNNTAEIKNKTIDGTYNTFLNIPSSAIDPNILTTSNTKTITNKTIDFSLNTVSNLPDAALSTNVLTLTNTKTVNNKTFIDQTTKLANYNDNTKLVEIKVPASQTTGTTSYYTLPTIFGGGNSDEIVGSTSSQSLSNKTMISMAFSGTHTGTYTASGVHNITNTTNATSSTTGGLVVSGGIGVAKDIYIASGNNLWVSNLNSPSGTFYINSGTKLEVYNTTDSTSKTSNAALKTNGGLSVAKDIYCNSVFGNNKLTDYYIVILENTTTQTLYKTTSHNIVFNTVSYNPSSMTTYTSSGGEDGFTLNVAGYWKITFHTHIPIPDTNPAYTFTYLTRVGSDYDLIISQFITSWDGSSAWGQSLTWSEIRYFNSGQRLAIYLNLQMTPATTVCGSGGNLGTRTRFSAQWMGS